MTLERVLDDHVDPPVLHPIGEHRPQRVHRADGRLDLPALHGEVGIARPRIAFDQLEPTARRSAQQFGKNDHRRAVRGEDRLMPAEIADRFHGRGAHVEHLDVRRDATDPGELGCVVLDGGRADDLVLRDALNKHGQRRAVLRRNAVQVVGAGDALRSRHVGHDDRGISWNMTTEVAGDQTTVKS